MLLNLTKPARSDLERINDIRRLYDQITINLARRELANQFEYRGNWFESSPDVQAKIWERRRQLNRRSSSIALRYEEIRTGNPSGYYGSKLPKFGV